MNLLLRMLFTLVGGLFRSRIDPLEVAVMNLHVWPNDLDFNGHMNNGRYLTIMDLGRIDFILRAGLGRHLFVHHWTPLVASAKVRFRRSLAPLQKYQLHTRLLCWDDKWFIVEQRFMVKERAVAIAYVKALFRGRDGNVPPAEALMAIGHTQASPPFPQFIRLWMEAEEINVID